MVTPSTNVIQLVRAIWFNAPVDPVALNIPHYFSIVRQEDARDLKTIKANVQAGKYESFSGIENDIRLMVDNAVKFNGEVSPVSEAARVLLKQWPKELKKLRRDDPRKNDVSGEPPAKRLKLS